MQKMRNGWLMDGYMFFASIHHKSDL